MLNILRILFVTALFFNGGVYVDYDDRLVQSGSYTSYVDYDLRTLPGYVGSVSYDSTIEYNYLQTGYTYVLESITGHQVAETWYMTHISFAKFNCDYGTNDIRNFSIFPTWGFSLNPNPTENNYAYEVGTFLLHYCLHCNDAPLHFASNLSLDTSQDSVGQPLNTLSAVSENSQIGSTFSLMGGDLGHASSPWNVCAERLMAVWHNGYFLSVANYESAWEAGRVFGDEQGYNRGLVDGADTTAGNVFTDLATSIVNVPISILAGLSVFSILDTPIIAIIVTFLLVAIVLLIVKRFI